MKLFLKILAIAVISLGVGVFVAYAQSYTPIAPLPGTFTGAEGSETTNMALYLSGLIKLLIALGAALAVLFAIIGGTQYVAASINPSAKADALGKVQNALIGLAIILTSYLLLNSINPNLVHVDFKLPVISTRPPASDGVAPIPISTATFREEAATRAVLANNSKIIINKSACTSVGQENCTSVQNLNGRAISGLRALDEKTCSRRNALGGRSYDCNVIVTGGTEYWLHRTHGDGTVETSTKVDLRKGDTNGIVDNYVKRNGVIPETPCGLRNAPKYQPDGPTGGTYVDEGDHWHVCY